MTVTLIVEEGIETEGEHYKWQLKGKEHVCLILQPKFVLCKNIYVDEIFNDFFLLASWDRAVVKVPAIKTENLNVIPRTHMVK